LLLLELLLPSLLEFSDASLKLGHLVGLIQSIVKLLPKAEQLFVTRVLTGFGRGCGAFCFSSVLNQSLAGFLEPLYLPGS
jgi:hypothetical protein